MYESSGGSSASKRITACRFVSSGNASTPSKRASPVVRGRIIT